MNPVLVEIYSTIVPSMPFIIGAYVLMWLAILVYMLVITLSYKKARSRWRFWKRPSRNCRQSSRMATGFPVVLQ